MTALYDTLDTLNANAPASLRKRVETLLNELPPSSGRTRVVNHCDDCGQLHARQFIPYGLGRGVSIGQCHCVLTTNNPNITLLLEVTP